MVEGIEVFYSLFQYLPAKKKKIRNSPVSASILGSFELSNDDLTLLLFSSKKKKKKGSHFIFSKYCSIKITLSLILSSSCPRQNLYTQKLRIYEIGPQCFQASPANLLAQVI